MVGAPAQCTRCGHRFAAPHLIDLTDAGEGGSMEQVYTACPNCRGPAAFLEGRFNVADGGIEMLSGPAWSWALVEELGLTLRRIVRESPPDPIAAIAATHRPFAEDVQRATRRLSRRELFELLAILVGLLTADYAQIGDLVEAVGSALRYVAEHGTPPPPL